MKENVWEPVATSPVVLFSLSQVCLAVMLGDNLSVNVGVVLIGQH